MHRGCASWTPMVGWCSVVPPGACSRRRREPSSAADGGWC
ncbi:hypothetical protein HMPREF0682_0945 [Propionibacterium acidifaciens F0233]|uniref:Uncharacterized protein n=1 Tax=Propionibacterium acidifaciens F0233 TaxID=553198 RepID=U2SFP1_9ACTN|nr:hypothetical protein HMPREF0682_0945 [Propionibacterium acidifaciens F0233]